MRQGVFGALLAFVLVLVACPASGAGLPVEAFGCGDDVDHSVKLESDVGSFAAGCDTFGLVIQKSGITLDLGQHTIYGDREDDVALAEGGIQIADGVKNVTIRNGAVRGFVDGVRAPGSHGRTVLKGIVAIDNLSLGFFFIGDGAVIKKNVAADNGADGFKLSGADLKIAGNVAVRNAGDGVTLLEAKRATIKKNRISLNGSDGIESVDARSKVVGNVVTSNAQEGITSAGAGVVIEDNVASGNGGVGIVMGGEGSKMIGNRVSDNDVGISGDTNRSSFARNVASGNDTFGIATAGDRNTYRGNRTDGNGENGVFIFGDNMTFAGNRASGNAGSGVILDGSGEIRDTLAVGNGFGLSGNDLGIDASAASMTGKGNIARANDDEADCAPTSLCKEIDSGLPGRDLVCGEVVTESVRLTGDVGSSGARCLLSGITIAADGIEVDLDGNTIWGNAINDDGDGNGASEFGIGLGGHKDVRVYDGRVVGFERGINLGGTRDVTVSDIEVTSATGSGITDIGDDTKRLRIVRSISRNNGFHGVSLFKPAVVDHVVARSNDLNGVGLTGESAGSGVVAVDNIESGIVVQCCAGDADGVTVTKSIAIGNGEFGISVRDLNATITNNIVTDNGPSVGPDFTAGIDVHALLAGAGGVVVRRNISTHNGGAGFQTDTARTTFKANVASGHVRSGFQIDAPQVRLVGNVSASSTADGVTVNGDDAVVKANTFYGSFDEGIDVTTGDGSEITSNRVVGNGTDGILVTTVGSVSVDGNRALGNGFESPIPDGLERGIVVTGPVTGSNTAFGNDDDDDCSPSSLC